MPFFSKVFRKDGTGTSSKSKKGAGQANGETVAPPQPRWEDAWARKEIAPEEIQELIHECTREMKSRALDMPFLLLPYRPGSDAGSSRVFIGKFFKAKYEGNSYFSGAGLQQELRLTEPMVLCSLMKWCWSRLPGGVVTWDVYEMFKMGEQDSEMKRHAFETFIPLAVGPPNPTNTARKQIIFDFFDLLAAIAARGKANGLGGRKLSRMAGWWAFEHTDHGNGFDGGYKSWQTAADATSHLFFAYLRSLSPETTGGVQGISQLPRSLQSLLSQTEYPPERPTLMYTTTPKVVMIVDSVSPTPFALLRRAKHFEYRDDDAALQEFSAYEDPVKALTDECRRVLNAVSQINQSAIIENGTGKNKQDPSWSNFEDLGFAGFENAVPTDTYGSGARAETASLPSTGMRGNAQPRNQNFDRPTTPSWADFLSTGFADEQGTKVSAPMLLPPDKVLPPIGEGPRGHSSQSHMRPSQNEANLEPGELASITSFELDDTFWWVWMTSLAGEEPVDRKAVFGRCALIETNISHGRWLVVEEQVKGASPGPEEGAYIAEKKSRFSLRGRLTRRKSMGKKGSMPLKEPYSRSAQSTPYSRITIGEDQQATIRAAAAKLKNESSRAGPETRAPNRLDDGTQSKTQSALTLQPQIVSEAGPAMKWAKEFDRGAIRDHYLNNPTAGTGRSMENLAMANQSSTKLTNGSTTQFLPQGASDRDLPALPQETAAATSTTAAYAAQSQRPVTPPAKLPPPPPPPVPTQVEEPSLAEHPAMSNVAVAQQHSEPTTYAKNVDSAPKRSTSSPGSPTDGRTSPNKLRKEKPTGLKKLFTKKSKSHRESKAVSPPAQPIYQEYNDSPPVAPGKASYEPEPESLPEREAPLPPHQHYDDSLHDISRVPSHEERAAVDEFSRFDQGPLDDIPVFVPPESPVDAAPAPPDFGHPANSVTLRPAADRSPMPTPSIQAESDTIPEESEESSTFGDRPTEKWTHAGRFDQDRARHVSEERSGPSASGRSHSHSQSFSKTTDDGDTSGEETIESRVARIKARVAELTGNMESSAKR